MNYDLDSQPQTLTVSVLLGDLRVELRNRWRSI